MCPDIEHIEPRNHTIERVMSEYDAFPERTSLLYTLSFDEKFTSKPIDKLKVFFSRSVLNLCLIVVEIKFNRIEKVFIQTEISLSAASDLIGMMCSMVGDDCSHVLRTGPLKSPAGSLNVS